MTVDGQIVQDIAKFYADPLGFVLYAYPWGQPGMLDHSGPDRWQREFLSELGAEVRKRLRRGTSGSPDPDGHLQRSWRGQVGSVRLVGGLDHVDPAASPGHGHRDHLYPAGYENLGGNQAVDRPVRDAALVQPEQRQNVLLWP